MGQKYSKKTKLMALFELWNKLVYYLCFDKFSLWIKSHEFSPELIIRFVFILFWILIFLATGAGIFV